VVHCCNDVADSRGNAANRPGGLHKLRLAAPPQPHRQLLHPRNKPFVSRSDCDAPLRPWPAAEGGSAAPAANHGLRTNDSDAVTPAWGGGASQAIDVPDSPLPEHTPADQEYADAGVKAPSAVQTAAAGVERDSGRQHRGFGGANRGVGGGSADLSGRLECDGTCVGPGGLRPDAGADDCAPQIACGGVASGRGAALQEASSGMDTVCAQHHALNPGAEHRPRAWPPSTHAQISKGDIWSESGPAWACFASEAVDVHNSLSQPPLVLSPDRVDARVGAFAPSAARDASASAECGGRTGHDSDVGRSGGDAGKRVRCDRPLFDTGVAELGVPPQPLSLVQISQRDLFSGATPAWACLDSQPNDARESLWQISPAAGECDDAAGGRDFDCAGRGVSRDGIDVCTNIAKCDGGSADPGGSGPDHGGDSQNYCASQVTIYRDSPERGEALEGALSGAEMSHSQNYPSDIGSKPFTQVTHRVVEDDNLSALSPSNRALTSDHCSSSRKTSVDLGAAGSHVVDWVHEQGVPLGMRLHRSATTGQIIISSISGAGAAAGLRVGDNVLEVNGDTTSRGVEKWLVATQKRGGLLSVRVRRRFASVFFASATPWKRRKGYDNIWYDTREEMSSC